MMALADERAIYGRCRGFTPSEEDSFCYAGYTARKIISTLKCSNALAYDLLEEMVSDEEKSKLISVCLYTFEQINKSGIRYADFIVRYTGMDQDTRKATMSYCNAYSAGWCLTIRNETGKGWAEKYYFATERQIIDFIFYDVLRPTIDAPAVLRDRYVSNVFYSKAPATRPTIYTFHDAKAVNEFIEDYEFKTIQIIEIFPAQDERDYFIRTNCNLLHRVKVHSVFNQIDANNIIDGVVNAYFHSAEYIVLFCEKRPSLLPSIAQAISDTMGAAYNGEDEIMDELVTDTMALQIKKMYANLRVFSFRAIFPYTKYPVISSQEGIPVTQLRNMVTYCKEHYFQDCVGTQFDKARLLGVATNCLRKFKLDAEVMEKAREDFDFVEYLQSEARTPLTGYGKVQAFEKQGILYGQSTKIYCGSKEAFLAIHRGELPEELPDTIRYEVTDSCMWVTRISDSQGYPIEEYHFESGWRGDDFIGKNTTDPTVLKPAKWLRETNVITTHASPKPMEIVTIRTCKELNEFLVKNEDKTIFLTEIYSQLAKSRGSIVKPNGATYCCIATNKPFCSKHADTIARFLLKAHMHSADYFVLYTPHKQKVVNSIAQSICDTMHVAGDYKYAPELKLIMDLSLQTMARRLSLYANHVSGEGKEVPVYLQRALTVCKHRYFVPCFGCFALDDNNAEEIVTMLRKYAPHLLPGDTAKHGEEA